MPRIVSREAAIVLAIAAASLALRLAFAATLDIFQDEALYWWQGCKVGVSFAPHPPAMPLAGRWATWLLGERVLAFRALSLASGTAAIVLAWLLGRDLYGRRTGLWAAGLLASCPLFVLLGAVCTPDATLVALWLLATWSAWRGANASGLGWWVVCGLAIALGLYDKYMMVLALPGGLVALAASQRGRAILRRPGPWVAAGLGMGLFAPVFLVWNWLNGWDPIRYHLASRHVWEASWGMWGQYLGGHAAGISPVLYVGVLGAFVASWRSWRRGDWRGAWLLGFGLLPILFFLPPSVFTKPELLRVQWDEFGYAVGAVALAATIAGANGTRLGPLTRRRLGLWAIGLALVATLVLSAGSLWPTLAMAAIGRPTTAKMLGWPELAARVAREQRAWKDNSPFIVGDSFVTALCLAYHLDCPDGIYALNHARNDHYGVRDQMRAWRIDEWRMRRDRAGQDAIFVQELRLTEDKGASDFARRIWRFFDSVELIGDADVTVSGKLVRSFRLYRCRGCRPLFGSDPPLD